uniref:KilA-N domain-containing protein n=1 Tax=viral metagenome TaxID=1070528 RepID=A0A6C0I5E3_9ZZZZ
MNYNCETCNIIFTTKRRLISHYDTDKHKIALNLYDFWSTKHKNDTTILENKYNQLKTLYDTLNIKYEDIIKDINEKDKTIQLLNDRYNDYKNMAENLSLQYNTKKVDKEKHMFQIDINLNNKQLNKTKYKDVPEDIVINNIQSLKLKDNYQLEYRQEDGYINITNLCKAGGKEFKSWNRLDKTKRFLDVLSSTVKISTFELLKQEQGGNGERHTWAHPQVSINIAQWISPEFDVLVSKWVYEIMLTGKVDILNNKTTQELDTMNKENKLLKNRIKLLESKVLQKQPRQTFEENKNVVYIVTTEYKEAQGHYKIGKAQDLQKRLSTLNTSDKHEVIYNTSCKNKKIMDILETMVHSRLEDKRIEPNKEWFVSEEDAEDLIKIIQECKKVIDC